MSVVRTPTTRLKDPETGKIITVNTRDLADKDGVLSSKFANYQRIGEEHQEPVSITTSEGEDTQDAPVMSPEEVAELTEKLAALPNKPAVVAYVQENYNIEVDSNATKKEMIASALELIIAAKVEASSADQE